MKKTFLLVCVAIYAIIALTSCSTSRIFIPQAKNTVKSVSLDELNLTTKDYDILDRIEATACIILEVHPTSYKIYEKNGLFNLSYKIDIKKGTLTLLKSTGVLRTGYLSRNYGNIDPTDAGEIVRSLAIYRLINQSKELGADGIIEPVISTNVEETGRNQYTFETTVSGKAIRLKTSK